MALMKSREVPKDAIELNELEATGYAWDLVANWESLSDTWALRYGAIALGAINSISGILINQHYRWRFKLGSYGHFSSVVPIAVMPGILTIAFHKHIVSTELLLMKNDKCPVCYEVRSAALQTVLGIVYPMILAPTSALMFANRYSTYRIPHLKEGPKVMFQFLRHHTKSLAGTLTYLAVLQLAASTVITYYEMKNNITLRHKVMELEQKLLEKKNKIKTIMN